MYLYLSLVYPLLFLYTSLSIRIDSYLFLSLRQSKFTATPFKPIFFILVYLFCIHLYICFYLLYICQCWIVYLPIFVSISCLFTSISLYLFVNPDWFLSLSIPSSIQIHGYIFQIRFLYLCLFFVYPPIFVSISYPFSFFPLCIFINQDWCLPLSISLSIQIHACLFLSRFLYFCLFFVYPTIFVSISYPFTCISLYLFVNLFLSFCQSNFTTISFKPVFFISVYSLFIHLYVFVPLCQSILIPISFYLFVNPNSRLHLSNQFSLS